MIDRTWKTAEEEALYTQCQQILSNRIRTQSLSFQDTVGAIGGLLGSQLGIMSEPGDPISRLIDDTTDALQLEYRTRTAPPLPGFADYKTDPDYTPTQPCFDLGQSLNDYIMGAAVEHVMSVAGTWRVGVALGADVFAMPRLVGMPLEDIDAIIESIREALPHLMP